MSGHVFRYGPFGLIRILKSYIQLKAEGAVEVEVGVELGNNLT